jgi:hypothetical protein
VSWVECMAEGGVHNSRPQPGGSIHSGCWVESAALQDPYTLSSPDEDQD